MCVPYKNIHITSTFKTFSTQSAFFKYIIVRHNGPIRGEIHVYRYIDDLHIQARSDAHRMTVLFLKQVQYAGRGLPQHLWFE